MTMYKITVDLEKVSIDEAVYIETMGKKDAKGHLVNKDASFEKLVTILERAAVVEGTSIRALPLPAIAQIMDAFMLEVEAMSAPTGPTEASV